MHSGQNLSSTHLHIAVGNGYACTLISAVPSCAVVAGSKAMFCIYCSLGRQQSRCIVGNPTTCWIPSQDSPTTLAPSMMSACAPLASKNATKNSGGCLSSIEFYISPRGNGTSELNTTFFLAAGEQPVNISSMPTVNTCPAGDSKQATHMHVHACCSRSH